MVEIAGMEVASKKGTANLSANSSLLALFWTLAEGKEEKRLEATRCMVRILTDKQGTETEVAQEVEYALKRLIKGLASSRKFARLGYATALAQVLRALPVLSTKHVMVKIKEELTPVRMDVKSDRSNLFLGKVMAFLALTQAGTLEKASSKELGDVVKQLLHIRSKKVPIHQVCVQAICQILKMVSSETFSESIWHQLEHELKCGWEKCTPDTLQLLMVVSKSHPSVVSKSFLLEHWDAKKIICEKNMTQLRLIMLKSTCDHPIIHSVCFDIIKRALKYADFFPVFWKNIISDKIMTQSLERRFMGMRLVDFALRSASSVAQVKIIMNETVVQTILTNTCDKNKPLHAASKKLCDDLVSFVASCPNVDMQLSVITALITSPSTVLFDSVTKTKTIHEMVAKLSPEGSMLWADIMMDIILGKTDTILGDLTTQGQDELTKWALCELLRLVTSPIMVSQDGWYLKLIRFLFLHGFFSVTKASDKIPLCVETNTNEIDESCRPLIAGAFYKTLDKLSTIKLPGQTNAKDIRPYLKLLEDSTEYAQLLLNAPKNVQPYKEIRSKVRGEWGRVLEAIEQIKSKLSKDRNIDEGHAFQLLYMCLGLQLFSVPKDAMEIIADLHVCCKKALVKKRRLSVKPDAEPEWVEVVTEMLLSLLSQESHLVRVVVTNVFKILAPHMTTPALNLVLNVVAPAGDEDGPLGFDDDSEDEEDDDDEEGEGEEEEGEPEDPESNGHGPEEEDGESSDDEDEDDDESDPEGEMDASFVKGLKDALGDAAIDSSDEGDVASDLDDDAMFKIDDALSQAFKNMVKNKKNSKDEKEKRQQLKAFKLKSLDLLNNFVLSEPAPHLALKLLLPLLGVMDQSAGDKTQAEVGRKASTVFRNLVHPRKFLPDPFLEKETLPGVVKELVDFSAGAHGVPIVLEVASAGIYVLRLLLGLESNMGPSPVRTRSRSAFKDTPKGKGKPVKNDLYDKVQKVIGESLRSFCLKRDTHLNHMLFYSMFDRMSGVMWPQTDELLTLLQNEDIRIYCRTQVCSMLTTMVKKPTLESIGEEAWASFSTVLVDVLPKVLNSVSAADPKPRFVHELLLLLLRSCAVSTVTMEELMTSEMKEKVAALRGIVKKDTKNVIKKIMNLTRTAKKRPANDVDDSDATKPKVLKKDHQVNGGGTPLRNKVSSEGEPNSENVKTPKSEKKKKRKSHSGSLTPMKENVVVNEPKPQTPKRVLEEDLAQEAEEKVKTPKSSKKKRKSLAPQLEDINESGINDDISKTPKSLSGGTYEGGKSSDKKKTPKSPKILNSDSFTGIRSSAKKVSKTPTLTDDPDNLAETLEMFTPISKVNRRRSTRLSLMKGGTPVGGTPSGKK